MDLSLFAPLLVVSGLVLWLPLIGKKWSATISYVIFGVLFGFGSMGYMLRSQPPAGNSESMAAISLGIGAIAAAMILLTYFVYKYRKRKGMRKRLDEAR